MPHQKVLFCIIQCNIKYNIFVWKIEKFVFYLFYFLLLSNKTLYLMFYTYIWYWSRFQYKYIIQITVVKQCHARVTSKGICLFFILLFFCLFSFSFDSVLFHEVLLLLCCLTHFIPLVFFYTPWKPQKSGGYLMFSGGKRDQWHKIG